MKKILTLTQIAAYVERSGDPNLALIRRERPYRFPKGYMKWETLSGLLAICCFADGRNDDLATQLNTARLKLWLVQNAPVYCLSNELLRAFEQTDVLQHRDILKDVAIAIPTFLLLLPSGSVRTPEGTAVSFCVIHLSDAENPERSEGSDLGIKVKYIPHDHQFNLHCSFVDDSQTVWFTGMGIESDGSILWDDERQIGEERTDAQEKLFLRGIRNLVLQSCLALTYKPELIEQTVSATATSRSVTSRSATSRARVIYPRWLGRNYVRPKTVVTVTKGSHASPLTHWRRGHWRRAAIGEGRVDRKWVWIQPTLVNA